MVKVFKSTAFVSLAIISGIVLAAVLARGASEIWDLPARNAETEEYVSALKKYLAEENKTIDLLVKSLPLWKPAFGDIPAETFQPNIAEKIIRLDFKQNKLEVYEKSELLKSFTIINSIHSLPAGRRADIFEKVPAGEYRVLQKKEEHFSHEAGVYLPLAIQFLGDFSIHGVPFYHGGSEINNNFNKDGVRLNQEDAKWLFDWSELGTLVSVSSTNDNPPKMIGTSSYFFKNGGRSPAVSAPSYLVGDLDSGEIIMEKGNTERFPIASVTKLITALTSIKILNQNDIATVSARAANTPSSGGHLKAEQKIAVFDLLYPLLLESSNDAAEVLAEHGGHEYFINQMNEIAKNIGMENTHFGDPSGLSSENKSTVTDLFKLAKYLKDYEKSILEITRQEKASTVSSVWKNINKLVQIKEYMGGKSGYTDAAQKTGIAFFALPFSEFDNRQIAIIVLHSADRVTDTNAILKYLKNEIFTAVNLKNLSEFRMEKPEFINRADLVLTGDLMLDRGVEASVNKNLENNFNRLFEKISWLGDADITFGNLEGPVSDQGKNLGNLYSFRMAPEALEAVKTAGFDVLSVANNHIGDWGLAALEDTLRRFSDTSVLPTGGGENKEVARKPVIFEKNRLKIGFLGFSDVGPTGFAVQDKRAGILLASDPDFEKIIRTAAEQTDFLVVSFHWGEEYKKKHNARQEELAHAAIDAGAKLIIGHHPHVVQDTEKYKDGFIAYSLGNFVFDQKFSKDTMQGLVLKIKIKGKEIEKITKNLVSLNSFFQPDKVVEIK
ncbi:hypothetical protein A3B93_00965 [Candidatus Nomurabacteria bacterium RIFCSPHIGHO2_02_FULL_42_24]|uniref:L,D-TPase catalytic domain-containing protein n=2 Tax=Candidatus Nomuraibacteriota TaxID=1752729 RepID=A0A1F6WLQ7_9BACT|nr:MAG: hypothetical protein A3B93_00965 [Candidatus Nomurabacteria bacterium RIFCSPHIGHO2_02_FULL_42_24]